MVPRLHLRDVLHASGGGTAEDRRDDVLVNAWWAAFAAGQAVSMVALVTGAGTSTPLLVLSRVLELAAAALAVCVIQRLTALQHAALGVPSPPGPLAHA